MTSFDEYKKRRGTRPARKAPVEKPIESKRLSPEEAAERRKRIFERPKVRTPSSAPVIPLRKNAAKLKPQREPRDRTRANKPKDLYNKREEKPKPTRRFDERTPQQERTFTERREQTAAFGEQRKAPLTEERRALKETTAQSQKPPRNTSGSRRDFERGVKFSRTPKTTDEKPKKKRSGKPRTWDPMKRKHTKPEEPKAPGTPERVQKLISAAGIAPRREAELMIEKGVVTVNGKIIKLGDKATEKDTIVVNGIALQFPQKVYLMLNKPKGYVTTVKDIYGNKTVMALVPNDDRIYPIGRLDKDTTGLLLFTNDGDFANRIMHPRYEIQKTYIATLDKPFNAADAALAKKGLRLEEGIVTASIKTLSARRVSVTLHQGFNHVVKRLMKQMGYWVQELERTKVGPLTCNIPVGAYRYLTDEEVKKFDTPTVEK